MPDLPGCVAAGKRRDEAAHKVHEAIEFHIQGPEEDRLPIPRPHFSVSLTGHPGLKIMGFAPMAVAHGHQRKGIGSALVHAGFERCKQLGFGAVVVLGHTEYYPRFGFSPATRLGIGCEYDVPEEVFMAVELQPGYLHGKSGTIRYHAAFRNV